MTTSIPAPTEVQLSAPALASAVERAAAMPPARSAAVRPSAMPGKHEFVLRAAAVDPDRAAAMQRIAELTAATLACTGKGLDLGDADLRGLDLSGFDLRSANLNRAALHDTNLSRCDLAQASMVCAGMERTKLEGASMRGAYVHAMAAQVCNFKDADLSGLVDATGSLFHGCPMAGVKLGGSMLSGATFYQCDLERASFQGANLQGATINECVVDNASFGAALVSQMTITKCRMRGATFSGASGTGLVLQRLTSCDELVLDNAHLPALRLDGLAGVGVSARSLDAPSADVLACALEAADFSRASLCASRWLSCRMPGIDLSGCKLEEAMFRACLFNGANLEAALCENVQIVECQLKKARMAKLGGRCVTIRDTAMDDVDLREAYLYRAVITGDPPSAAAMTNVDFRCANLVQAYVNANLRGADLRGANLTYARLNQANLAGADLSGCNMFQASMVKVNCAEARFSGVSAPVFVDRCGGLKEALASSENAEGFRTFMGDFENVMRSARGGST